MSKLLLYLGAHILSLTRPKFDIILTNWYRILRVQIENWCPILKRSRLHFALYSSYKTNLIRFSTWFTKQLSAVWLQRFRWMPLLCNLSPKETDLGLWLSQWSCQSHQCGRNMFAGRAQVSAIILEQQVLGSDETQTYHSFRFYLNISKIPPEI